MIYFLYGEDTYRSKEKLKEIIEGYKNNHKSGLSLFVLDFNDKNKPRFSDLNDNLRQVSMFMEKRMAVLLNSFSNIEFKKEFLSQKDKFLKSDDLIIFYEDKNADQREVLFKFLKSNAKCQKFEFLSGIKLKNWTIKELEKCGSKADEPALAAIIEYVGSDLWRLSNEIKKLSCYKKGVCLKKEDVFDITRSKIETDIFKTIDAIASKNQKQALGLIHDHIEKGDSPLYLLSMINYQFRNILIVKDLVQKRFPFGAIAAKTGLHPYVAKKSYFQCYKFSLDDLKRIYKEIFEADLNIKTGKIEPALALDLLISEV
jgi:DNA polymerase III delta subunit